MLANANPFINAPSETRTVREIIAVCGKHGVETGSPPCFVGFMRALHENKHLAMDFWATAARLIREKSGQQTQPDWLLAAIVEGVTDRSLAEATASPGAQRLLVRKLGHMLAGEDVQIAAEEIPAAPAPFATAEPEIDDVRVEEATEHDPVLKTEAILLDTAPRRPSLLSSEIPDAAASQSAPAFLREERPRLVLEPMPTFAAAQELNLREHANDHAAPNDWPNANDREIAIPLAAYAEANAGEGRRGRLVVGTIILMVVVGGGFLLTRHQNNSSLDRLGNSIRAAYESAAAAWHAKPQTSPPPSTPVAEKSTPPDVAPIQTSEPAPNLATGISTPHEPATPTTRIKSKDGADSSTTNDAAPAIEVAGAEMQDRLISSRVPVSPDPAHSDGRVILQAVVTSRGTVRHLRFAGGDPALTRAAVEAASTWRYRPYILDGTPVDVSTTITVDFSGDN